MGGNLTRANMSGTGKTDNRKLNAPEARHRRGVSYPTPIRDTGHIANLRIQT